MLPTIDFSLIGTLLVIWGVIKQIWAFIWGAIRWVKDQAITIMVGSRFWATAVFLGLTVTVIIAASEVISYVVAWLATLLLGSIPVSGVRESLRFLATFIPLRPIAALISTYYVGLFFCYTLENYSLWYIRLVGWLNGLKSSWKT